mgnify:CR=1 FL=1
MFTYSPQVTHFECIFSEPSTRYGFYSAKGICVKFSYTGCGGNENNFPSMGRCQLYCEDSCEQPVDEGIDRQTFTANKGVTEYVNCSS